MKLKTGLLLNASLRICPLTFINEALRLSVSPFVAIVLCHLSSLWQAFTMCCVNMATPIHFIDGNCHISTLYRPSLLCMPFSAKLTNEIMIIMIIYVRAGKSRETCLTNRTQRISHHITPLVINALGGRHRQTHTHTDAQTKAIMRAHPKAMRT